MNPDFRSAMSWLHTWAGVVIGVLLFAIFWMGTLSVFDREIDRWMKPDTRLPMPEQTVSLDRYVIPFLQREAPEARRWQIMLPTERVPVFNLKYDQGGATVIRDVNPHSGEVIPEQGTMAGTGFIFPFHFGLHLRWHDVGFWLVGLAGMAMLLQLVSGVLIHRKIFVNFFTFRRGQAFPRANLDLHTVTGVLFLPFHFLITLTGLIIFFNVYFPQAYLGAYGAGEDARALYSVESAGQISRTTTGNSGTLTSLDGMLERARLKWSGSEPYFVRVWNPGDAGSYVEVRRSPLREVSMNIDRLFYDGVSGALLERFEPGPVMQAQRFIAGIHFIRFEHWPLRILYFLGGLAGCIMIATGLLFWLEARRKLHARQGLSGVRLVEGLTIGGVAGLILATLMFFISNRLLPRDVVYAGIDRAALEVVIFYITWLAALGHAWLKPDGAWRLQCLAIALLGILAMLLNAVTTGDHLLRTLLIGNYAIAGMDIMLLAGSAVALWSAHKLKRRREQAVAEGDRQLNEQYV